MKSVFQALPVYIFSALAAPIKVIREIEKLYKDFLWGVLLSLYTPTSVEKSPTHLVCPWRHKPKSKPTVSSIWTSSV
jgi:hypothetical protein